MMQIPMCDHDTFNLLMELRSRTDLLKFGNIAPCLTGELDMTQGKKYLTDDSSKQMLVKGVQIARYVFKKTNEEISQGKIEFVDVDEFFKKCSVEKKEQTTHERIALQGLSGINEKQRLKAVLIPKDMILANSANFLQYQMNYPPKLLLALFNSKLLNFIFKATSTSSNVNGYEVDALPLPQISEKNDKLRKDIISLADQILVAKKSDNAADTIPLEHEIDNLVYKFYGINDQREIDLIEGK